jgi:ABC-2 type transport system ATP-binding protein
MPSSTAVVATGLRKQYRHNLVLDDVDLRIERGEVFALLGPNGAGKTTTVEILSGFRKPTSGTVRVLGEDPAGAGARWRAKVGHVGQTTGSFHDLTVRELVRHFGGFYPHARPAQDVIELVGLTDKTGAKAATLSGGQQRRLDIAIGVVGNPELLLLDEPTTGLDPKARHQIWDLVGDLAEGGTTVLLTTHYMEEVEALADRVAMLAGGKVREVATPGELGGRAKAEARVTFRAPPEMAAVRLSDRFGRSAVTVDATGLITITTSTPTEALEFLIAAARTHGVDELPELAVTRKSLEEVYLALVARWAAPAAGEDQKRHAR